MAAVDGERRILLLSYYFPPDLSAGSFRSKALVDALMRRFGSKVTLHVIAAQPNRYLSMAKKAELVESLCDGRLLIDRVDIPQHSGGMVTQAISYAVYALKSIRLARSNRYCLVIATSSRLMTAVLGSFVSRRANAIYYLDIRDIFVDNIGYVFPRRMRWLAKCFFSYLERWALRNSSQVNLVSKGFKSYFYYKYPTLSYSCYTNGIDELFIREAADNVFSQTIKGPGCARRILYAGNIGQAQCLHNIIPEFASLLPSNFEVVIVGDGARKIMLEEEVSRLGLKNVVIYKPVARQLLIEMYRSADVLFLHLDDNPSMHKVLPSKIFEYAATEKPIVAGVSGYAAEFIAEEIVNAAVFKPGDSYGAISALDKIEYGLSKRKKFIDYYRRTRIMDQMADEIYNVTDR
ncbi:glycosyltransferase family 4 protein [Microbulbifer salipaludis]|uniref:Glycosyltransferase family 4 protein n=1 Tax=Microbulbifer salipaludis TaxID=187980 RepID=A0ABS3E8Y8_9GAMM|nr:glycosyltransferase family 4 protein [Microbulbifer salipaludis]MBN8431783.1 glycosyltransferase family 4 protein [Microbulbifer salipaludis]